MKVANFLPSEVLIALSLFKWEFLGVLQVAVCKVHPNHVGFGSSSVFYNGSLVIENSQFYERCVKSLALPLVG